MFNDASTDSGDSAGPASPDEDFPESWEVGVGRCPVCSRTRRRLHRRAQDDVAVCTKCFSEHVATKLDGNGIVRREPQGAVELIVRSPIGDERILATYMKDEFVGNGPAKDSWMHMYEHFDAAFDQLMSTT